MSVDVPAMMRMALEGLRASFALVDADLKIVKCSPGFIDYVTGEEAFLVGLSLYDLFPELVGQEDVVREILKGERPFWRLENIHREGGGSEVGRYLTMVIASTGMGAGVPLLVLVNDVTEQGLYLQQLMQSKNELRLARQRLLRLNEQLNYLLRHYVPHQVADALLAGRLGVGPIGESRLVSVLFADARGFTTLTERLPPEDVMRVLNEYLNVIASAIDEAGGTVGQFQGDGVLGIFNAPGDLPDHAWQAVQAAVALQERISALRARQGKGKPRLRFGVGISTGPALLGNVGARWQYTYTAIGDVVNLAARITAVALGDEIWISAATRAELPPTVTVVPLPPRRFKGRSRPTELFRVVYGTG